MPFLLSDTVGFIRKLPHHLIESFKSTLDEVRESDILLHVVDIAHPHYEDHIRTVEETLNSLKIEGKRQILIFNKIDLYRERYFDEMLEDDIRVDILNELKEKLQNRHPDYKIILISALERENVDALRALLKKEIEEEYTIRYPYQTHHF
jgi:GTP-binding protein HflX